MTQTRKNMGLEEAILEEVKEQAREQGVQQGVQKGSLLTTIKNIQKALKRGKLTLEEIAEDFELSLP